MPKEITVRFLSNYQVEQLKEMFARHIIDKIGREDESGDLFIRYRGGTDFGDWDGVMKTKSIPSKPPKSKDK